MSYNPRALPVVYLDDESFRIDVEAFNSVLKKVGSLPIAILSINGSTRTGKSYLLDHFIHYFEFKKRHRSSSSWYESTTGLTFGWRSGRERETVGINLWSKPYFVKTPEGDKMAVLLMDTQGLFDDQTTARQNAIIFSISTLCSSVIMFNTMRLIDDNILQQVEYFSGYAHMASAYQNPDQEGGRGGSCNANGNKMLFLVRDFGLPEYDFGLHTEDDMPPDSDRNYFLDTFHLARNCPEQNKTVRQNILRNFSSVSVYCLPDPGRKFIRQMGRDVRPDDAFQKHVVTFVETMVQPENLVKKTVLGKEMTGLELGQFIKTWAELCENSNDIFPDVLTMADSTAFTQYSIAFNQAISKYTAKMDKYLEKKRGSATLEELEEAHEKYSEAATTVFSKNHKVHHRKYNAEFSRKLEKELRHRFRDVKREHEILMEAKIQAEREERKLMRKIRQIQREMEEERERMEREIREAKEAEERLREERRELDRRVRDIPTTIRFTPRPSCDPLDEVIRSLDPFRNPDPCSIT